MDFNRGVVKAFQDVLGGLKGSQGTRNWFPEVSESFQEDLDVPRRFKTFQWVLVFFLKPHGTYLKPQECP